MASLSIPSYAQGFARNAAEAAYPGLWDGLVELWQPTLGVTGPTLFNLGGSGNHGTLTNMTLDTSWVMTAEGPALAFGGDLEHVVLERTAFNLNVDVSPFSVLIRFRTIDAGTAVQMFASNTAGNRKLYCSWEFPTAQHADFGMNIATAVGINCADGNWHTDAFNCWDNAGGGIVDLYRDGFYRANKTQTYDACSWAVDYIGRGGTSYGIFDLGLLAGWNRALTPAEHLLLHHDPHAIVRPKARLVVKVAAAAGGNAPTGTIFGPLCGPFAGVL